MDNLHVYSIVHNDLELAPFWLRCYRDWWGASRLVVYDHDSTDGTGAWLRAQGVEVRDYHGEYDELELLDLFSACWQGTGSNWVAVVSFDEFLFHPQPVLHLADMLVRGVDMARTEGYYMIADSVPQDDGRQLWEHVKTGRRDPYSDKPLLFRPHITLRFTTGCHSAVTGSVRHDDGEPVKILHYRYLGAARYRAQNERGFVRMSNRNRAENYGYHMRPEATEADIRRLQTAERTAVI